MNRLGSVVSLVCAAALLNARAAVDYSRDILPILSDKCYHCHGPDEKARKGKLRLDTKEGAFAPRKGGETVIAPGKSSESELVRRITTTNVDDKMPPPDSNRSLTPKQIELLTMWIDEGANWGMHWALVAPPSVISEPVISKSVGSTARDSLITDSLITDSLITDSLITDSLITDYLIRNPIDSFVAARLLKEVLKPSREADKPTLLRRVTLDLTGLPPTLKELDDFLADTSTNAYEKVVDRLLASPRYGERMASEWLDLARYADTHGYQMDRFRPMWPYRDWVIKAFNQNLSYDQFVTWQLAGDLLPNATKEQRLATAFNRLHNQNEEGGIVEEEYRVAYVVDRVNTFGTAFLGLTTECTRCHDHKYDPLTQKDFYSLFAFFQNIDESGQTSYFTDAMPVPTLLLSTDEQDKKLKEFGTRISAKELQLANLRQEARASFDQWRSAHQDNQNLSITNGLVARFEFDEVVSNKVANLAGTNVARAQEGPELITGKSGLAAALSGENGFTFPGVGHFTRADEFTLALWLRTPSPAPRMVVAHHSKAPIDAGSRGYELLIEDGKLAFGLHHMWPRNSLKVASKSPLPTNEWVHVAATYDGSSRAGGVKLFVNGTAVEFDVIRDGLWKDITYGSGEPELAIGYRFRDNGFKGGAVDDFRVYDRAVTAAEAATLARHVNDSGAAVPAAIRPLAVPAGGSSTSRDGQWTNTGGTPAPLNDPDPALFDFFFETQFAPARSVATDLHQLRDEQRKFINPISEAMVMEELPKPKRAYVLKRGAYDSPGEEVVADTPKVFPPFPNDAPRNRLGLAQWLLRPDHPLFARVTVNRAWQLMFGRGIVETSDNFGSQGAQPTHPELLDWLAREFASVPPASRRVSAPSRQDAGGTLRWDMKRLLKTIATSATYRQSSKTSPELFARDPHNELLARGPAHRLTSEMLRDQALSLSGLLVEKMGGPSVKPYQPDGVWEIAMGKPKYDQGHGEELYRRSLYTFWKRTVPPPSMVNFDAADRSYCTARRQSTSTPLQALALLNDVQLVETARLLGQRMLNEGGVNTDAQLAWIFRTATTRSASAKELSVLKKLFAEQRELFARDEEAAKRLLALGEAKADGQLSAIDLAAATIVAETLLNHDATVMKR